MLESSQDKCRRPIALPNGLLGGIMPYKPNHQGSLLTHAMMVLLIRLLKSSERPLERTGDDRWELASLRVRARKMIEEACEQVSHPVGT